MFEHRSKKVLPLNQFLMRQLWFAVYTAILLGFCLTLGTVGYHVFSKLQWLDAMLNASMILTGMGPLDHPPTSAAKWFASLYAIFSGVAFPSLVAVFLAPLFHRLMHKLHVTHGSSSSHGNPGHHNGDR